MAITNPVALHMSIPDYLVDNIIGIHTGSFTVSAPTDLSSPTTATDTFTTGFGDSCLFQGVFSTDSGSTWNDFGVMIPNLTTAGQPVLQTVTCYGWIDSSGILTANGVNYYDYVHSTSQSYTIQYKVVFFAKDTQGSITPLSTNEILQYNSAYNYQKIDLKGSFANASTATTVSHNLGYIPKVRSWIDLTTSTYAGYGNVSVPTNSISTPDLWPQTYPVIKISTSSAIFNPILDGNGNLAVGNIFYRIYLDS